LTLLIVFYFVLLRGIKMKDERWVIIGKGKKAHLLDIFDTYTLCNIGEKTSPASPEAEKCKTCIRELSCLERD
jgi:hypothetical protein